MNEIIWLGIVWLCGAVLGFFFYGGLQWTVGKIQTAKRPALLFFFSLLFRMTVILAGFYFLGRGHWERMLVCLVGFIMARFVLTWLMIRLPGAKDSRLERGTGNAPES